MILSDNHTAPTAFTEEANEGKLTGLITNGRLKEMLTKMEVNRVQTKLTG